MLPIDSQKRETFLISDSLIFFSGERIVHLSLNKSAKPASGPLFSVPATGCPGIQVELLIFLLLMILLIPFFTEHVSVIIDPCFRLSFIESITLSKLLKGVAINIKSEFETASLKFAAT